MDAPLGRRNYTSLCVACFHGAEQCVKFLVSQGADVGFRNDHGETLDDCVAAGEAEAVERSPDEAIFVRERFRRTRSFIDARKRFLERQRARGPVDYYGRARPPRIAAALRILHWWRAARRRPAATPTPAPTSRPPAARRRRGGTRGPGRARAQSGSE